MGTCFGSRDGTHTWPHSASRGVPLMRASNTFAAAFSPGSVFTMCATMGSPVSGTCSVSGRTSAGRVCSGVAIPTVNHELVVLYTDGMPLYEFKCKTCDSVFEERRSMAEANSPATCPQGHDSTVRLLSVFASLGASASTSMPAPTSGGSCCGGGCCN